MERILPQVVGTLMAYGLGILTAITFGLTPANQATEKLAKQPVVAQVQEASPTLTAAPADTATSTPVPKATNTRLPSPTSTNKPTATSTKAPTATSTPIFPIVNNGANLRSGPSTDYAVIGGAAQGQYLTIVGTNSTGDWYQLSSGAWIAGFLVDNSPATLPKIEVAPPTPTSTSTPVPTTVVRQSAIPTKNQPSGQRYGARCRDGTHSGATGRGACSHHGGVAEWLVYP